MCHNGLEFSSLDGYVTRVESDLAVIRPLMGRVNEFHVLVFDPSHPAHSSTAQTRGMSSFPAMKAAPLAAASFATREIFN
jgi:hypothetical protein